MLSIVCLSGKAQMTDWALASSGLLNSRRTTQVIQATPTRVYEARIPLACKAKHEQQQIVDQNAINANTAALRACATGVCVFVVDGVIADGVPRGGRNDHHLLLDEEERFGI